jgi:excinuclease UvrABC nuclease subunit
MTAQSSYGMTFDGYWRDEHEADLPSLSGVYCVYICVDHPDTHEVMLNELIYIGESDDLRTCVANHEKRSLWKAHLIAGEDLCYSFAHVAPSDRLRCAAALIYRHQPRDNSQYRLDFPFDRTTISLDGHIAHLHSNFTVERSAERTLSA